MGARVPRVTRPAVCPTLSRVTIDGLLAPLRRLNDSLKRTTHVYMVVVALVVGVLGGYGAVGFKHIILWMQDGFWETTEFSLDYVRGLPWYAVVVIPAVGGLLCGWIIARFAPEAKGHGVPEVMEAVAVRGGRIRPRVVVAKAVASGLSIGSGGSVGREGPIVQIGAAIGSATAQALGMSARRMRTLVGCGAAAGIAATFNAPVAGALFAVEVVLGDFGVPQFSPIVISSVMATVVSRHYLGDLPAFEIPPYSLVHPTELFLYGVLGVLAGLLAIAFVKVLYFSEDRADEVKLPLALKAAVGGALVGALALAIPGVLGMGYESMNLALTGTPTVTFLALLLTAKLVAVCITIASGGSGGILMPSLFLGATLGALVGAIANAIFGAGVVGAPGAYALVGMGAVLGAVTHAPISAILILFELTNDYRIILPLMISCILATLLATKLMRGSIYTLKLIRRGIDIASGQDVNLLKSVSVRDVLRDEVPTIAPAVRLGALALRLSAGSDASLYVVDDERHLIGVVGLNELQSLLPDLDVLRDIVVAGDIAATHGPRVGVDDTLDHVLETLDVGYRDELPVMDGERLVGIVRIEDVLARYKRELVRREVEQEQAARQL
ncbi:MAG: chloride channel protein [Planctomycetes bacterium]|nr:chloride channel protein [Planctomycetota bacterium]